MKALFVLILISLFTLSAFAGEPTEQQRNLFEEAMRGQTVVLFPSVKIRTGVNIQLVSKNPQRGTIKILDTETVFQTPEVKKEF